MYMCVTLICSTGKHNHYLRYSPDNYTGYASHAAPKATSAAFGEVLPFAFGDAFIAFIAP